jgi:predicted nucleotide-binding protein (sugar kinase/HSP70/actin superfamily)
MYGLQQIKEINKNLKEFIKYVKENNEFRKRITEQNAKSDALDILDFLINYTYSMDTHESTRAGELCDKLNAIIDNLPRSK